MSRDRGAATILILSLCGVIAVIGIATAALGVLFDARERAATAAEAAALAAAVATYPPAATGAPASLAAEYADRNGASMVSCRCPIDPALRARVSVVTVALYARLPVLGEVQVVKTARAEFDPRAWLGR